MKKFFLAFLLFISTLGFSADWTRFFGAFIVVDTQSITVDWDDMAGATKYEVRVRYLDQNEIYSTKTVTTSQTTIDRPRAGHFALEVRAGNNNNQWSEWSSSIDGGKINNQNTPWMLYWKLPSPGGVIVE